MMITVELVGGAKKLFGTDRVHIERSEITVTGIFEVLLDMRVAGSPALDPRNTLVAINGIDTSAADGMDSVAKSGDTVSVIPVIHGGARGRERFEIGGRHLEVLAVRPEGPPGSTFLDDLRGRHPKLSIQALSAKFALNRSHVQKILALSTESDKRGILIANRIETDILMRFALTTQISAAIRTAGIKPSSSDAFLIVSMGPTRALNSLYRELEPLLTEPFTADNAGFLRKKFRITKRTLNSAPSETPLEDVLAERAAVLNASAA